MPPLLGGQLRLLSLPFGVRFCLPPLLFCAFLLLLLVLCEPFVKLRTRVRHTGLLGLSHPAERLTQTFVNIFPFGIPEC